MRYGQPMAVSPHIAKFTIIEAKRFSPYERERGGGPAAKETKASEDGKCGGGLAVKETKASEDGGGPAAKETKASEDGKYGEEVAEKAQMKVKTIRDQSNEEVFREMHVSIAKAFWTLTQPRSKEQASLKAMLQHTLKKDKLQGLEDLEELEIVMDQEQPCLKGEEHILGDSDAERPFTKSLDVQFMVDEGEAKSTQKSPPFDICFRVIDRRVNVISKSVAVLVVKCQYRPFTLDNFFQVAAYTCTLAKENMAKERYEPIYLEVWDDRSW
ncbi:hypothetical protein GOP47_0006133, partial [Adiantum capillus-veneris]